MCVQGTGLATGSYSRLGVLNRGLTCSSRDRWAVPEQSGSSRSQSGPAESGAFICFRLLLAGADSLQVLLLHPSAALRMLCWWSGKVGPVVLSVLG